MVFIRDVNWQDDDPNSRPRIDNILLGKEPAIDFSKILGTDNWREIDTEGAVIDKLDEISELIYDDGEGFVYKLRSTDYSSRLSEWMREANNTLRAIERKEEMHPEFLVKKGIALAAIGIVSGEEHASDSLLIKDIYERKLPRLKEYLIALVSHLDINVRNKYNLHIDDLAEDDSRWERKIFKDTAPKKTSYQIVIAAWAEEAHDDDIYHLKNPGKKAAEILDRGLKIIQNIKTDGTEDELRENANVFYDCLFKLSEIIGRKKGRQYEDMYKSALDE